MERPTDCISGVYEIRNTVTGDTYIGSAADMENRWKGHRADLRAGRHRARRMQDDWNTYGPDAFVFTVLEHVAPAYGLRYSPYAPIAEAEVRWIVERQPTYNTLTKMTHSMHRHALTDGTPTAHTPTAALPRGEVDPNDLIGIQHAAANHHRSRRWLEMQVEASELHTVKIPGDKNLYLLRSELERLLRPRVVKAALGSEATQ